jgi:hypothetical protein
MACRACISCNPPNIAKSAHANQKPQTQAPKKRQKQEDKEAKRVEAPKVTERNIRNEKRGVFSEKAPRRSSPTQP